MRPTIKGTYERGLASLEKLLACTLGAKMITTDSVIDRIEELLQTPSETVVFCGAGISFHSGLPVVQQLVPALLDELNLTDFQRAALWSGWDGLTMPFEAFMESFSKFSVADPLFDIYNAGRPNTTHKLIAKLMRQGSIQTVCTTNFDLLIERALEEEGFQEGRDYEVLYYEEHFERHDFKSSRPCLVKIHGGLQDSSRMAITLQQVATEILAPGRGRVVDHFFAEGDHAAVLIMGYSSSDIFDISPLIEEIQGAGKEILYIEHSDECRVEPISHRETKNPFRRFKTGSRLFFNTDRLVERLWSSFAGDEVYRLRHESTPWQEQVRLWREANEAQSVGEFREAIAGHLFLKRSDYDEARQFWQRAFIAAEESGDPTRVAHWSGNLGFLLLEGKDYEAARELFQNALDIARASGDLATEAVQLGHLGMCDFVLKEYEAAEGYFQTAFEMSRQLGDPALESVHLVNLGNVAVSQQDFALATRRYEDALALARDLGDVALEGRITENLGAVRSRQGELGKAATQYDVAFALAHDLGDIRRAGPLLVASAQLKTLEEHEQAFVNDELEPEEFLESVLGSFTGRLVDQAPQAGHLREGIEILGPLFKNLGGAMNRILSGGPAPPLTGSEDPLAMAVVWIEHKARGELAQEEEDWSAAAEHYQQALAAFEKAEQDDEELLELLSNFALVCLKLERGSEAKTYYERAWELARREDPTSEYRVCARLGELCLDLKDFALAGRCFERASVLAHSFENVKAEGLWQGKGGVAHMGLEEFDEAKNLLAKAAAVSRKAKEYHLLLYWLGHLADTAKALGDTAELEGYQRERLSVLKEIRRLKGER